MSAEPVGDGEQLVTLEELTELVGISVRNIRFYTSRGLIPAPIKRGRSGYYAPDHIARLQLVRELQAHGFTLSAIEKYVARIPANATPDEIALHRITLQPWQTDQLEVLSLAELSARAGRKVDAEYLRRLEEVGAKLTPKGSRYEVDPTLLESAMRLVNLDVPAYLVAACQEVYERHGRELAEELGVLLETTLWPAYKEGQVTTEQMVSMLENFQQTSITAVIDAFNHAVTDARRAAAEKRAR
jgi:DNA-binding transcriptional MerR regulator